VEGFRAAGVPFFCDHLTLPQGLAAMGRFIEHIQSSDRDMSERDWTNLGSQKWPTWERSPWLNAKLVREVCTPAFYDLSHSTVQKSSTMTEVSLYAALRQCQQPYIAVVMTSASSRNSMTDKQSQSALRPR
jgi:hypothetical protein